MPLHHDLTTRRQMLRHTACGFGSLALWAMLAQHTAATPISPLASRPAHHRARAKRVIFLFMQGGPSHIDSYDYKPALEKFDGEQMPFDHARKVANTGARGTMERVMKSPWKFRRYGQTGRRASELFPETARLIDELCFIHSLHTEGVAHGPSTLFLHTGSTAQVRPSMGSWITYGLGSENQNLPGFVTINPSTGNGGARNYGPAFLPAAYQGTALGKAGDPIEKTTIRNLANTRMSHDEQERQLSFLHAINTQQQAARPRDSELDAVVNSFELAWRMQNAAPDVLDISGESRETLDLYGIGRAETDMYGKQCLMARRLAESGVRYIQVTYGDGTANPRWDQHSNLPRHMDHARATDRPVAGLLMDLKQRGLLEDTLVWWGGEFGRTPFAERNGTGRDHNPAGFTMWLAGGGVKSGLSLGATDDFGAKAVQDKVHMHDLHATMLWLLGLDHEKLTYRYAGRDFRLTDVYGHVVTELFA